MHAAMARSWALSLFFGSLLILNIFAAQSSARHLDEAKVEPADVDKPGRNIYPRPPSPIAPHEAKKDHHATSDEAKKVHPAAHEVLGHKLIVILIN